MSYDDLSQLSVVPYHKDHVVELIRHKSGWDRRTEVVNKAQINYIDQYLRSKTINSKTMAVEYEYIDRHYLEDYSEYYARCFPQHPRSCARIHFFSFDFKESELLEAIRNNDKDFIDKLKENYLGFAVIRPIPKTCIAKLCLKPYKATDAAKPESLLEIQKIIKKENNISFFGIPLSIETSPFLEQDKVVSACATSAIWTLLNATYQKPLDNTPSPSAITKSALDPTTDGVRTFPNTGLTAIQAARSLKFFDLEPTILYNNPESKSEVSFIDNLKQYIYSYVGSDLPVIIGGNVYEEIHGELTHKGKHLVCVLGFKIKPGSIRNSKIHGNNIDRIYVHDDRYGPYVKLDLTEVCTDKKNLVQKIFSGKNKIVDAFKIDIEDEQGEVVKREYFEPDIAIVGLYHKIRLPYSTIRDMMTVFNWCASEKSMQFLAKEKQENNSSEKRKLKTISDQMKRYSEGVLQINIVENHGIKNYAINSDDFFSYNGAADKDGFLCSSLPKYMWRCRTIVDSKIHSDILIDATEVPQGKSIVGYLAYSNEAHNLFQSIYSQIKNHEWEWTNDKNTPALVPELIGSFITFFSEQDLPRLVVRYGRLKLPKRNLKNGEFNKISNVTYRDDLLFAEAGNLQANNKVWVSLDKTKKYIWVINADGNLIIGEDKHLKLNHQSQDEFQGHPTLTNSHAARVGGELYFNNSIWVVNLRSRAYPCGYAPFSEDWNQLLDTIIELNLTGLEVQKESQSL